MKRSLWIGLVLLVPAIGMAQMNEAPTAVPVTKIRVYFTPGNMVESAIATEIDAAQRDIFVQAYSFTNPLIVQALTDAHARGVKVVVVLDKSNRTQKHSAADVTTLAGIPTLIDDRHAIAHNKIMIIDGQIVITGSYNFSRAAERSNAENMVIIESEPIADKYRQNWEKHYRHSKPHKARADARLESLSDTRQ